MASADPKDRITIVIGAAALVFGLATLDVVTGGPISAHDAGAVAWMSAHHTAQLNVLMIWTSLLGGPAATSVYATLAAAGYAMHRRFPAAGAIAALVYGGALLNFLLKLVLERARPIVEAPLVTLPTYSFPSGHAAASTVFGGLVCVVAWRSRASGAQRLIVGTAVVTGVAMVWTSRVYLGLHYPTDIVAGAAEGCLWLALWLREADRRAVDLRWRLPDARPA